MSLSTMNMVNDFSLWSSNTDKICLSNAIFFYFRKIYRPHYLTSPKCPKICVTGSIDLNGLIQYLACLENLLNEIM